MSVSQLQANLKQKGFDPGPVDGALGARTYQAFADYLNGKPTPKGAGDLLALNLASGEITLRLRLIHFFAQVTHESGFKPALENLNYSPAGLKSTFSRQRISAADCDRLGRASGHPADQEAIANLVYGGAWGQTNLGNNQAGDGWRFRGRGLIQLTGRANYKRTSPAYEINPDLVATAAGSVKAAVDFWRTRAINAAADADDVDAVTHLVNGGQTGIDDRRALTLKAKAVWPA